jgi:hypothetical protein
VIIGQTSEMYLCQQATSATYLDEQLRTAIENNVKSAVPKHCAIRSTHWQSMNPNDMTPLERCGVVMFVAIYEQVEW